MQIGIHQTHHLIADFDDIFSYLKTTFSKKQDLDTLHIFPELFLTGYPLQDLCLDQIFIDKYLKFYDQLNDWIQSLPASNQEALVGGLEYKMDSNGLPLEIKNKIFRLRPSKKIEAVYTKRLLPNYDIFDEQKYFKAGNESAFIDFKGFNLALMICEDMWTSSMHSIDPVEEMLTDMKKAKKSADLVINLSASPYHLGKIEKRESRAKEIAKRFGAHFCYVNKSGVEDEIIFDGHSFICDDKSTLLKAKGFEPQEIYYEIRREDKVEQKSELKSKVDNTWESLYKPHVHSEKGKSSPIINSLSDQESQELLRAINFGVQEYAQKCHFTKFVVALSGGIDSSLVLAIAKLGLKEGQTLEAVFMPGLYTEGLSYDLSFQLCKNLNVPLTTLPIKFFHTSIRNGYKDSFKSEMEGLADENIQSRIRGALLYARSNQTNAMVLNTSNKSELAVGYSTLYGDSVGAISPLGDVYKSEVFDLANYINKQSEKEIIPEQVITRPPSAELRENQKDADSLPPYERLDSILEYILTARLTLEEIVNLGYSREEVQKTFHLYERSEYKRSQFCPIIKVKAKSFGFGHRVPICKKSLNLT